MKYTRIGAYLFDWQPLVCLSMEARNLWFVLYASAIAKRYPPGIVYTTLAELCETGAMGSVDAQNGLREMVDKGTILYDKPRRVIMLTSLPDRGERPASGKVLYAFWRKWKDLPESPLRYAYLPILHWLAGHGPTENYHSVWNETFGSVGAEPLATAPDTVSCPVVRALDRVPDTVSETVVTPTGSSVGSAQAGTTPDFVESGRGPVDNFSPPVDNFEKHEQPPLFTEKEPCGQHTVSDRVSHTVSYTVGYRDRATGLGLGSSQGESEGGRAPPEPQRVNRGRDLGAKSARGGPSKPTPFTVQQLLDAVHRSSGGRVSIEPLDPRVGAELWRVVDACAETEVTLADAVLAGEFLAAGHLDYRSDLDASWLAKSGSLLGVVAKARLWEGRGKPPLADERRRTKGDDRGPTAQDWAAEAARLEAIGQ